MLGWRSHAPPQEDTSLREPVASVPDNILVRVEQTVLFAEKGAKAQQAKKAQQVSKDVNSPLSEGHGLTVTVVTIGDSLLLSQVKFGYSW